jgi:hypothetical protein
MRHMSGSLLTALRPLTGAEAVFTAARPRGLNRTNRENAGAMRRYHAPPEALRTITALLVLRDQVLRPILAGVRVPRRGRKPTTWTRTDQHYETLRIDMNALFNDLGIAA